MARKTGYARVQIALHWLVAVLIVAAYLLSDGMGDALRQRVQSGTTGLAGGTLHTWLGGAAFLLILLRIVARLILGAPPAPAGTPPLWETAATWGHRLLYTLMILVPLFGALTWYLGLKLGDPHEILANLLLIVAAGHVGAAILHEVMLRDGTMARMKRPGA